MFKCLLVKNMLGLKVSLSQWTPTIGVNPLRAKSIRLHFVLSWVLRSSRIVVRLSMMHFDKNFANSVYSKLVMLTTFLQLANG